MSLWDRERVSDAQLADARGGFVDGSAAPLGADEALQSARMGAQDMRVGFDNWFADRGRL